MSEHYGYHEARVIYPNSYGETLDEVIIRIKARGDTIDETEFRRGWADAVASWREVVKDIGPLSQEQGHDAGD